jgi:hypothetical protein
MRIAATAVLALLAAGPAGAESLLATHTPATISPENNLNGVSIYMQGITIPQPPPLHVKGHDFASYESGFCDAVRLALPHAGPFISVEAPQPNKPPLRISCPKDQP